MRIPISALMGMTVTLSGLPVLAQPAPVTEAPTAPLPPAAVLDPRASLMTSDVPVPPPPAGLVPAPEPPPVLSTPFPPDESASDERLELVGFRGGFFLRDARDHFRLYPQGMAQTDVYAFAGPGVDKVPGADASTGLAPRLFVRRARIGFSAEILKQWSVTAMLEFGGEPLANTAGNTEIYASKSGQTPTDNSARYAPIASVTSAAVPLDVYISYSVCKCFNVQVGHFNVPFSLENRTGDVYSTLMERSLAIRSFVTSGQVRDLGGMVWGELGPKVFNYELGVFGGDGQNRPSVDAQIDFIGRIYARPFAGGASSDLARYAQVGISARHGHRDPRKVAYDYGNLSTAQGFVLWKPTYTDSQKRLVHLIPSGAQDAIGGELRLRVSRIAVQGEAYVVDNNTREAVDGYQFTNTERFGRIRGVGWSVQASAWPFGEPFLSPDPGVMRPHHLDLNAKPPAYLPHGFELVALVSGVNAHYDGAARLHSTADSKTPNGDITVYQLGLNATYWYTKHARMTLSYMAYYTPGSGTSANTAVVPDNLQTLADGTPSLGNLLHEFGARLAVAF